MCVESRVILKDDRVVRVSDFLFLFSEFLLDQLCRTTIKQVESHLREQNMKITLVSLQYNHTELSFDLI